MFFRSLRRLLVASNSTAAAIEPRTADTLALLGARIAQGERVDDASLAVACGASEANVAGACGASEANAAGAAEMAERLAAPAFVPRGKDGQKIALVSFRGLVTYDVEFQPYAVSTRGFAETMRQLSADSSVSAVVLYVDSPGGTVVGLPEAADAVYQCQQVKPVTAIVDVLCASAAYYVASQAGQIVALPSGVGVGSIGVRMMHVDCSEMMAGSGVKMTHIFSGDYKVEGNPFEPLSDDARARYQYECDTLYQGFLQAVARGRGKSVEDVRENFGKGRVLMPAEAKRVGMIDRLETPQQALKRLGVLAISADFVPAEVIASAEADDATTLATAEPQATEVVAPTAVEDKSVNDGLTASGEVETAAVAYLERQRFLLDLAGY